MTAPLDVEAVRAALAKATRSPWVATDRLVVVEAGAIAQAHTQEDADLIAMLRNEASALLDAIACLTAELATLRGAASAADLQTARLDKIAEYVGAVDYIDSTGPIFTAIDALRAERDAATARAAEMERERDAAISKASHENALCEWAKSLLDSERRDHSEMWKRLESIGDANERAIVMHRRAQANEGAAARLDAVNAERERNRVGMMELVAAWQAEAERWKAVAMEERERCIEIVDSYVSRDIKHDVIAKIRALAAPEVKS